MSGLINEYIDKDPISFIHVKELLDRNYSIIYESEFGFIIHDDDLDFTYMSFSNEDIMKEELDKKRYKHYISYDKEVVDYYKDAESVIKLHQFVYNKTDVFDIKDYDIRVLTSEYASVVDSFYKAIGPNETSADVINKKELLGLFDNDKLAGIIGRHPEGCIGMLYIFEEYRGKGYAKALEKSMINKLINEKQRVFCEVKDGNQASMQLQNKLGFIKGERNIYWLV